jgi:hypothetical protein
VTPTPVVGRPAVVGPIAAARTFNAVVRSQLRLPSRAFVHHVNRIARPAVAFLVSVPSIGSELVVGRTTTGRYLGTRTAIVSILPMGVTR